MQLILPARSVNSPGSRAFVTKESFSAELPVKLPAARGQHSEGMIRFWNKPWVHHRDSLMIRIFNDDSNLFLYM